ncbi:hypothetical protein ACFE04_006096 [Oxalis oulophora]
MAFGRLKSGGGAEFRRCNESYDPLDPSANITITWDIKRWTDDGYTAAVTMYNFQQYRHIQSPGWQMGWTWAKKEVIWGMVGAQTTEQGDCSRFKGPDPPHCCKKRPTVVDLLPGTPYNQQTANCCKGGVLSSWIQDPAPGPGYTCGPAKIVKPSRFFTPDKRRVTQALMTWNITCTYSQFLAQKTPTCCVSMSAFYNKTVVPCQRCACGCQNNLAQTGGCVNEDDSHLAQVVPATGKNGYVPPLVRCTRHMCPIRIHWHIKLNYREYWRVKITITNFNYAMNYSQWNLVLQHPNFDNLTQLFSFNYNSLSPYGVANDTALLWGVKFYNDLLQTSGTNGNVQSELLFQKDFSSFTFDKGWAFPRRTLLGKKDPLTFDKGWAFPRRVYFNGDNCVMPSPDEYPWLPNASPRIAISRVTIMMTFLTALVFLLGQA